MGLNLCNLTNGGETTTGYIYTEELKEVRRSARKGWVFSEDVKKAIAGSLNKKVVCVDTGVIYLSLKAATKQSGIPKSTFHRKLHNGGLINGKLYKYVN